MSLADLSLANAAAVLTWEVTVCQPRLVTVSYEYQGRSISYQKFVCFLSTSTPGDYIKGEVKNTKKDNTQAAQALAKYKAGTHWAMKKPKLLTDLKTQYISTPVKFVVDMAMTSFQSKSPPEGHPLGHAVPSLTVAEVAELSPSCTFDLKAYVTSCSDIREVLQDRKVMDVTIEDGSDCHGKLATLTMSIFGNAGDKDFQFLEQMRGKAIFLYGLHGKKTDRGYNVTNSREWLCVEAPDTIKLEKSFESLASVEATSKFAMGFEPDHDMDFSNEPAFQTCVCILDKFLNLLLVSFFCKHCFSLHLFLKD